MQRLRATRFARIIAVAITITAAMDVDAAPAGKFNKMLDVDAPAPKFADLEGLDGKRHELADYREHEVLVLFFTDNHCPASRLYEPRLRALLKEFGKNRLAVVAVNPAGDTLESMRKHAAKRGWTFDYLRDPSQRTAKAYGAVRTPQFFVLDRQRTIAYMGALDNRDDAEKVTKHYLRDALRALLSGKRPAPRETLQRGCKIEFTEKAEQ